MKTLAAAAAALTILAAGPAAAVETLTASFTQPDGGVTVNKYHGDVRITVSGSGQSLAQRFNDAFYLFLPLPISHDPSYYQLTFGTKTLVARDPQQDAARAIVGALPTYNPDHVYTFLLDTGTKTPAQLHFGVSDGMFRDNTGAYIITVTVPEPAAWALLTVGFGLVGTAMRRRGRGVVAS